MPHFNIVITIGIGWEVTNLISMRVNSTHDSVQSLWPKWVFLPLEHLWCSFRTMPFTNTLCSLSITCTFSSFGARAVIVNGSWFPLGAEVHWMWSLSYWGRIYKFAICGVFNLLNLNTLGSMGIREELTNEGFWESCFNGFGSEVNIDNEPYIHCVNKVCGEQRFWSGFLKSVQVYFLLEPQCPPLVIS